MINLKTRRELAALGLGAAALIPSENNIRA